ncbi:MULTISPECIES: PAS domain S-box protein, partial [Trichocoleus]
MTDAKAVISSHSSFIPNTETTGLLESEARFRFVLEASPDGFTILRTVRDQAGAIADFSIEYVNPVVARGVNRRPEEIVGQQLLQLFPECKNSGIFDRYVTVAETGISETFETFYNSQALTGWFRNVVVKLNDGIAVSFSNITDRKQAELALQQQEQHFKVALQTAKLGSWEHDLITGVLTCSAQCKANFGLPADAEFTHETLFAVLHPDDVPLVQAAIERSIQSGTDYEVEERCYHPDGSLHWLIVRGQIIYEANGTPIRMVGVTLDITERKQFEESLRAANQHTSNILESITDAFIAFDRDWRYIYVNQEAARMLGRSPGDLLGQRWQDVFPEVARQNTVTGRALHQAMTEQVSARLEVFSLAAQRWIEMSIFPSPNGVAAWFRDISDRKRAEHRRDAQYAIARILAEATTIAEAAPAILQALCENLGWQVGVLWSVIPEPPVLHCIDCWQAPDAELHKFIQTSQQMTFVSGVGIPGRVWANRQPLWITEISQDSNFLRATLSSQTGLKSAFGFPIQLGHEILGIIECFSDRVQEPDPDLLQMMAAIGSQIGQFMERKRTEIALRESQDLFQSFMNHSPMAAFI